MSISSAIQLKQQQVAAAYTACDEKGATMPAAGSQNLSNLASTIATISGGGGLPSGFIDGAVGGGYYDIDFPDKIVECCMSPLIDMSNRGGHDITFCWGAAIGSSSIGSAVYTNIDGTGDAYIYYATSNNMGITVTFDTTYKSCRLLILKDYMQFAFVRDDTTGEYLFKGSDYVDEPQYVLPSGYTRYDYLQCDANAYIDTGITAKSPISMWAKIVHTTTLGDYVMVGARKDNGNTRLFLIAPNNSSINVGYGSYKGTSVNNTIAFSEHTPIVVRSSLSSGFQLLNVVATITPNEGMWLGSDSFDIDTGKNIYLFCANYSSPSHVPSGDRIYEIRLYNDANFGNLVFHGIPCTNGSSIAGLYDLVSETFFSNAGSGTFTVGND